jgi:hypothetical protein
MWNRQGGIVSWNRSLDAICAHVLNIYQACILLFRVDHVQFRLER